MRMDIKLKNRSYPLYFERGAFPDTALIFGIKGRALIISDDGVPGEYPYYVAKSFTRAEIMTIPQGESSKSMETLCAILNRMFEMSLDRNDCIVAVGGGVCGDVAGFAASCYMRGIAFYNVPTTLLSQLDASIGGKTAVNFHGIKNLVGTFYQPKGVLIDSSLLMTLPKKQFYNGLAEAIKMALIADESLLSLIEKGDYMYTVDEITYRAVCIKKQFVEKDENDTGVRHLLNFGHTLGHGIESVSGLLHGESVALGMLPMCDKPVRERLIPIFNRTGLNNKLSCSADDIISAAMHDKKNVNGQICVIKVHTPGSAVQEYVTKTELKRLCKYYFPAND